MAYDYSKLKGRIVEKYGTRKEFAKQLGLSEVAMSNKMNNKSGFSQDDVIVWAKALCIPEKEYGIYFFYPQS
jgi:hypothetical protein